MGACAVTFTVAGQSVLNAIAGACSDDLPVICMVGALEAPTPMTMELIIGFFTILLGCLILAKSLGAFRKSLVIRLSNQIALEAAVEPAADQAVNRL
ncbi:hypothetical protein DVH24_014796 [Malus domestica]|uniref:Uncharacterized protein n=1 Tax=Malus domestica TaxID=3750 RepID=A0A498K231_MALDO|nr:hypothetical protein DVH24_014796 [Malus domestica]